MDDSHGCLNIFQRKVVLIRMALLRLCAVKRTLKIGQQLLEAHNAIFLALDDAITLSKGLILSSNLGLCRH